MTRDEIDNLKFGDRVFCITATTLFRGIIELGIFGRHDKTSDDHILIFRGEQDELQCIYIDAVFTTEEEAGRNANDYMYAAIDRINKKGIHGF